MEKYIKSISDLNLGEKITSGSCSTICTYTPGIYFKHFNEDYWDLNDEINLEFFETIKYLSEIKDIPSIIRATDIYRSHSELFGYTMTEVKAETLENISDNTLVLDLINSFKKLKSEIIILSSNHVKTEDIGGDNILYNGRLYLLDLDLSLIDKRYVPDELYSQTTYRIFHSLLKRITGKVYDYDGMYEFRRNLRLGNSDEYILYFKTLIELCSNIAGSEVKTLEDTKKAYQKIYRKMTRCDI